MRVTAALAATHFAPVLDADGLVGLHYVSDLEVWVYLWESRQCTNYQLLLRSTEKPFEINFTCIT